MLIRLPREMPALPALSTAQIADSVYQRSTSFARAVEHLLTDDVEKSGYLIPATLGVL